MALFVLPFIIIQGLWTTRNYIVHHKIFVPTQTEFYSGYLPSMLAAFKFQGCFGDMKTGYFFPNGTWQNMNPDLKNVQEVIFPVETFTNDFNNDSLLELRKFAPIIISKNLPAAQKNFYDQLFTQKLNRYTSSLKKNHKFLVYVKAPLFRLSDHIFKTSGVQFLFSKPFKKLTLIQKAIKLFFVTIYMLAYYGAIFFILKTAFRPKFDIPLLLSCCCLYGMLVHPLIMGTSDVRYLYVSYPFIALCATIFYTSVTNKIIYEKVINHIANI